MRKLDKEIKCESPLSKRGINVGNISIRKQCYSTHTGQILIFSKTGASLIH